MKTPTAIITASATITAAEVEAGPEVAAEAEVEVAVTVTEEVTAVVVVVVVVVVEPVTAVQVVARATEYRVPVTAPLILHRPIVLYALRMQPFSTTSYAPPSVAVTAALIPEILIVPTVV